MLILRVLCDQHLLRIDLLLLLLHDKVTLIKLHLKDREWQRLVLRLVDTAAGTVGGLSHLGSHFLLLVVELLTLNDLLATLLKVDFLNRS